MQLYALRKNAKNVIFYLDRIQDQKKSFKKNLDAKKRAKVACAL